MKNVNTAHQGMHLKAIIVHLTLVMVLTLAWLMQLYIMMF